MCDHLRYVAVQARGIRKFTKGQGPRFDHKMFWDYKVWNGVENLFDSTHKASNITARLIDSKSGRD